MRISRKAAFGYLIRSARLFSEAWRCAPTVVFSPRLDYTLVRYGWITRSSVSYSGHRWQITV
ncbi:BQ5605_C008g05241 [Microbotryum silenes-dioicae]|uniref:BQ5605_C008g05241 protein n=1 Tax=Microbotryum silenes-dioicae TaxID=796604 RepID=A0A2X0MH78_9BASI|nr:BQ5605_C129g13352 [Microbotryum silenes-dioicae]SGY79873.1 BQ5605_C008g05241 [Microbotryum silenes-dioicae]